MKILAVSDQPSDYLWGSGVHEGLKGIDLILSCGDLSAHYLSYLVTFAHAPLLYVPGNHDRKYQNDPPEGCDNVDGRLVVCKGLRILGLGGSIRYNYDSPYQYTQKEMRRRVRRLWLQLKIMGGFDILLAHAGAFGLGDDADPAHIGFEAFNKLLDDWEPAVFLHGHTHMNYGVQIQREERYKNTRVINAFERYCFEL